MDEKKEVVKTALVEETALGKIKGYMELGLTLPEGFNPTNSLKKARLMLNDMKVGGNPVLDVCEEKSVIQCLLDSVMKGLDYSESQIYFIPRGNQMTNLESVYGRIARAQRASKNYKPIVCYVHEGDEFDFGVDLETGYTKIKRHETKLENLDKPFLAAYAYVTDNDGNTEVFIMPRREWLKSWNKSSNGASVAKDFERDMIYRSIVKKSTKALVNASKNTSFGNYSNDDDDTPLAGNTIPVVEDKKEYSNYEEVVEPINVDKETGEIVQPAPTEEKKPVGRPKKETGNEPQANENVEF